VNESDSCWKKLKGATPGEKRKNKVGNAFYGKFLDCLLITNVSLQENEWKPTYRILACSFFIQLFAGTAKYLTEKHQLKKVNRVGKGSYLY
jgi:hypothetical protein